MNDPHHHQNLEEDAPETPVSLRRIVQTLHAYRYAFVLGAAAVALLYTIAALALYLRAPAERLTSLPFRLDFDGAAEGLYPNELKFSASDIVATPTLTKVYDKNDLKRFLSMEQFSASVFVLEANQALELLTLEYRAKLSDPKLSPVDRERVQSEFEAKTASLAKNDYSLNFSSRSKAEIPDSLVSKTLHDILQEWARHAVVDLRARQYRVALLSPAMMTPSAGELADPVVAVVGLRSKLHRIYGNMHSLEELPGAELARTRNEGLTIADIEARLEDLIRFRLEPLTTRAGGTEASLRFLQTQLDIARRASATRRSEVNAIQQALAAYESQGKVAELIRKSTTQNGGGETAGTTEVIAPQISDTFVDRLVSLTRQTFDVKERQKLIDELRRSAVALGPAEQEVLYLEQTLGQVRASAGAADPTLVRNEIRAISEEARTLLIRLHELYRTTSQNIDPANQLYTISAPPAKRVERFTNGPRFVIIGIVLVLASLPVMMIAALLHNRVREEEKVAHHHHHEEQQLTS